MTAMTIGRLAGAGGVGVETVRYYQRRGLLDTMLTQSLAAARERGGKGLGKAIGVHHVAIQAIRARGHGG